MRRGTKRNGGSARKSPRRFVLLTLAAVAGAAAFAFWPSDPSPLPDAYWQFYYAGVGSFERGEYERAESKFEHAIRLAPQQPEPKKYLGATLVALKKPYRGIELLLEYLKAKPDDAEALLHTARGYVQEKNRDVAFLYYSQSCDAASRDVPVRKETARALLAAGKTLEAAARIQEAIRLAPDDRELTDLMQRAMRAEASAPIAGPRGVSSAPSGPQIPNPLAEIERSRRQTR
jgi:tetratricopeptide (TPR) repeat protein